jgi:lactose/cellobiose-specific phosphotransferase system IIC component
MNTAVRVLYEFNEKMERKSIFLAVRRGLTSIIPFLLLGSIALLVLSFPIPAYQSLMTRILGDHWKDALMYVRDGTFNIAALITVLCIGYAYGSEFVERRRRDLSPIIVAAVCLCSFIAISGINRQGFRMANFGVIGIFLAIVVAILSSSLFLMLSSIKALNVKVVADGADSAFNYSLSAIIPASITITLFALANQGLTIGFGISDIQGFASGIFSGVFSRIRSSFGQGILFMALVHLFWLFGVHGSNILEPVAQSIFAPALTANSEAIKLGLAPTQIFTKTFFDTFVLMGGCGTSICLVAAIFIVGKRKNQRRLAKLSLAPVVFNINELVVFGLPIVLNPAYAIPFLCTPLVMTVSSYLAMHSGLVPYTTKLVEWTTPVFLSGYISTGSIRGCILQAFNLGVGVLCYVPFVKLAERIADAQMEDTIKRVCAIVRHNEERGLASTLLSRHDDIGSVSRFLTADLEHDLGDGRISLFYQPQVDYEGSVFGAEALLRWKPRNGSGFIYPPLVTTLAEESKLIDKLGLSIFDIACGDLERLYALGYKTMTLSVNISSLQLENDCFAKNIAKIIERHGINPKDLKIEITEQLALSSGKKIIDQIKAINDLGFKLEMDDFGMGHSSLMYLKEYDFDTIKLDGSLVRDIRKNESCSDIISSIVALGKSLGYSVIAEYVESEEQRLMLHGLGCDKYQGYLYSPAIPFDELVGYLVDMKSGIAC